MRTQPYSLYRIVQISTGRVYIGLTRFFRMRWKRHLWAARNGQDHPLYEAMRSTGEKDFTMEILETFDDARIAHAAESARMQSDQTFIPVGFNKPPYRRNAHGA